MLILFLWALNLFVASASAHCCTCFWVIYNKQVFHQLHNEFCIPDDQIPSDKAINNRLSYYHKLIGQHTNSIEVAKAELCHYIFMGEEEHCEPFIYLYDTDDTGR
jgi:hypothetical protein